MSLVLALYDVITKEIVSEQLQLYSKSLIDLGTNLPLLQACAWICVQRSHLVNLGKWGLGRYGMPGLNIIR